MVKAGILGGGQLGRMLLQEAANYPVETYVMENDPECPAAHLCHHFVKGDIRDFDQVYSFGKQVDVLTIEIESVNVEALEKLEAEGVVIIPKPSALRIIRNKIDQKAFYTRHEIPTPEYKVVKDKAGLQAETDWFPAVQKLGEGGYDGKGVQILNSTNDLASGFDAPGILEKLVDIHQEIAVMVAINSKGEHVVFPPVEMVFNQRLNLLDYQICPARISENIRWKMEAIAIKLVKALSSPGLFAIELFIDRKGNILVNETAPRVHNSGHHTIEAHSCSQYDMLWRILLNYPLGNGDKILSSALINLIGETGHSGPVFYNGIEEVLRLDQAYVHLYGKKETRPGRKMGHITLTGNDAQELMHRAQKVKGILKVESRIE